METIKLKSNIHRLIDSIQNEQLLQSLYDFLKIKESSISGKIWDSLTDEQKREVYLAYEESEIIDNLIEKEKIISNK